MKLVLESSDDAFVRKMHLLLEENGIPAFISEKDTHRVLSYANAIKEGLWLYVDEHEKDARALIKDPNYVVCTPLNTDRFYKDRKKSRNALQIFSNLNGKNIVFIFVFVCLLLFLLITRLST